MKKKLFTTFFVFCLVAGTVFASGQSDGTFKALMGSSSLGGTWYPTACKIATVADAYEDLTVVVQATGGGTENVRLMGQKQLDMGLVEPNIAAYAWQGSNMFEGQKQAQLQFVTDLYPNAICGMVMKSSDIMTYYDLNYDKNGGRVLGFSPGSPGSGDEFCWKEILSGFGVSSDKLRWRPLSHSERVASFKDRYLECLGFSTAQPSGAIIEASAQTPIRILEIKGAERDRICKEFPWYAPYTIPAGMYNGVDKPVETIYIGGYVLANSDVPEKFIYKYLKAMYSKEGVAQIQGVSAGTRDVKLENALGGNKDGSVVPFHPGAVKFYKEKGMIK